MATWVLACWVAPLPAPWRCALGPLRSTARLDKALLLPHGSKLEATP